MNKIFRFIPLLAAALLLGSATSSPAAKERPIRLTMTSQYMDRHAVVQKVWKPWIEEIKKRTNGRVIITYYNPNTICPEGEILGALQKGQIDIGQHYFARNPGTMPLCTVTGKIPMPPVDTEKSSVALWKLINDTPAMQEELKGLHPLAFHQTANLQLSTKDTPSYDLNELKKLRFLCSSKDSVLCAKSLGLNAIMQAQPDIYLSLSRNMAEGVFFPIPPMRSYKVNEATTATMLVNAISTPCYMAMNQTKWESLPDDVKQIFNETCGEVMSRAIGWALNEGEKEDMETMKKEGQTFIEVPEATRQEWKEMLRPKLREAWLEEVANTGLANPEELYNKAESYFSGL